MIRIFQNYSFWKQANLARSMKMNDGERRAFDAEIDVQELMKSMACTIETWRGLRIPKVLSRIGSGEVDVIVLTDRCILMIEVKFWKGKLSVDSNRCIQQNGRTPKPVLQTLESKVQNLKNLYLQRFKKDVEVEHLIVFAHSKSSLSPELSAFRNVCTLDCLEETVRNILSGRQSLSSEAINDYRRIINTFGQYDSLCTPAGACMFGDIVDQKSSELIARERCESVHIALSRGFLGSLLFGPRLEVTLNLRDGTQEQQSIRPGDHVYFSQPWKAASSDERKLPIEFFSSINFGTTEIILKDEDGHPTGVHEPLVVEATEKTVNHKVITNLDGVVENALKRFEEGEIYTGTIIKHLRNSAGLLDGILVSLENRLITGLLGRKQIAMINPGLLELYDVGRSIEVRISKIIGPKKIFLELY
ncbi:MAG: nuclease-related domain-containing protein [Candidatus Poseidoniaceae archaeon]